MSFLTKIFDILSKIPAGAPGPAGPETGSVPAWTETGTGRAGQDVGTYHPVSTAEKVVLSGGRGCRNTKRKRTTYLAKIPTC